MWKVSQNYPACILIDTAVVVERDGEEIEFFRDNKEAGSWIQHIYGLTPFEARDRNILIKTIKNRGPKAGDAVTYKSGGERGPFSYLLDEYKPKGLGGHPARESIFGILDHSYGQESFGITFNASAFRKHSLVSCSGGPIPNIIGSSLTFVGLRPTRFWRWCKGYSGGGQGGDYYIHVPNWEWDGTCKPIGE